MLVMNHSSRSPLLTGTVGAIALTLLFHPNVYAQSNGAINSPLYRGFLDFPFKERSRAIRWRSPLIQPIPVWARWMKRAIASLFLIYWWCDWAVQPVWLMKRAMWFP